MNGHALADRTQIEVFLDGLPITGLLRASVVSTNCFSADTYSLTFATGSFASGDTAFWSSISSAYMEVYAATSSTLGSICLVTGMIDTIHVDPIQGTVGVEGRDLSSSMIDAYRQQDFVNQTASEIVSAVAQYHNLLPVVTPTTNNIGRYYSDGYTKLSLGQFSRTQSDWDLLVQLARENNFDLFVQGRTLYFQPASNSFNFPVGVSMRNVQRMRIERALNLSDNIQTNVQSWDSQTMAAYQSQTPDSAQTASQDSSILNSPFLFAASNATSAQVTELASQYTAELGRLKTLLKLEVPWDLSLLPRSMILLYDTNSAFDTTYRIESVERHYSSTSGSMQTIYASQVSSF